MRKFLIRKKARIDEDSLSNMSVFLLSTKKKYILNASPSKSTTVPFVTAEGLPFTYAKCNLLLWFVSQGI